MHYPEEGGESTSTQESNVQHNSDLTKVYPSSDFRSKVYGEQLQNLIDSLKSKGMKEGDFEIYLKRPSNFLITKVNWDKFIFQFEVRIKEDFFKKEL